MPGNINTSPCSMGHSVAWEREFQLKLCYTWESLWSFSVEEHLKHHTCSARIYNTWTTALTFYYHVTKSNKSPKTQALKCGWSFTWVIILSFIIIAYHSWRCSQGRKSGFSCVLVAEFCLVGVLLQFTDLNFMAHLCLLGMMYIFTGNMGAFH